MTNIVTPEQQRASAKAAKAAAQKSADEKAVREIAADLEQRLKNWRDDRKPFVATEGRRRYEAWQAAMLAKFEHEAAADYEQESPPPSFANVANIYFRSSMAQEDFRAATIERLKAIYEAQRRPELAAPSVEGAQYTSAGWIDGVPIPSYQMPSGGWGR